MSQSLSKIYLHLIFSTKNRESLITPTTQKPLYDYIAGVLQNNDTKALEINGTADHIHILCQFSRTITVADLIRDLKSSSSKWYRSNHNSPEFSWQAGYGAFSVSHSDVGNVRNYIQNQEEHHRTRTFQEEYRLFLDRYQIPYDEKYVWD